MDMITRESLRDLIEERNNPCISLYMPTHRKLEAQQDRIRFKNLLRRAEDGLLGLGLRSPEAAAMLEPARKLLDDAMFWEYLSDGLALFLSKQSLRSYRLPYSLKEMVVVGERFQLKPLLPLLDYAAQFFILALSKNQVRLLRGTPLGAEQVELTNVPHSLSDALKYDQREKQLQYHTRTPRGLGRRAAVFHGHGTREEGDTEDILQYFRMIERGVREVLRNGGAPLILAGVDYLLPIYRQANSYPQLLEEGVTGNPDELTAEELHARVWPIVEPTLEKGRRRAMERYAELAAKGRASNQIGDVVPEAYFGRVDSLIVALGLEQWGAFDPDQRTVHVYPEQKPGCLDLLDFAAIHTLLNSGEVHAVTPDKVPGGKPLAAIFRY
jgi:hypothetical protein